MEEMLEERSKNIYFSKLHKCLCCVDPLKTSQMVHGINVKLVTRTSVIFSKLQYLGKITTSSLSCIVNGESVVIVTSAETSVFLLKGGAVHLYEISLVYR